MKEHRQIRIIKRDVSAARATRPLYEQAFADPPAFVDYYYREKMKDSTVVLLEEDGQIRSMLHLNPYTLSVCGTQVPSYYVVAVATDEKHRRKGFMARVLAAAREEMKREGIPFCFLLPVNEAIYTPFGFETICGFVTRGNPLSALSYGEILRQYDVFCVQDALYVRRREEEDALAAQDICEVLPDNPVIMARIIDQKAVCDLLKIPSGSVPESDTALLSRLRGLRCYFREEV